MMDLATSISISSISLTIGATILGSITLFNSSRRTTVDMLSKQVEVMRGEIAELQRHFDTCEKELAAIRSENQWLMSELRKKRTWFIGPSR
jgi:outer membrane murein-binding lipoprotein Lpp